MNLKIIFCYHRVIPMEVAKKEMVHRALYVTPKTFEKHIVWLKKIGSIVDVNELMKNDHKIKFMITFDDGWKDNLTYAYPILSKYKVPATIFLSTYNIDERKLFWTEELSKKIGVAIKSYKIDVIRIALIEVLKITNKKYNNSFNCKLDEIRYLIDAVIEVLKKLPKKNRQNILTKLYSAIQQEKELDDNMLLNWKDVRFLHRNRITFGSHTHTHALLNYEKESAIEDELELSKRMIEEKLMTTVDLFSYPNGYYEGGEIRRELVRSYYTYGFTLIPSPVTNDDLIVLPRCLVYEENSYFLQVYLIKMMAKVLVKGFKRLSAYS